MAEKKPVEYVILIEQADNDWRIAGNVSVPAGSRTATAKREGLKQFAPEGGNVVAIQASDWTPEDLRPQLSFA
jgi:hypothetical protein